MDQWKPMYVQNIVHKYVQLILIVAQLNAARLI